jgi:hypothetical protein
MADAYGPKVVESGMWQSQWHIREWRTEVDEVNYDWIFDRVGGDYSESDELFDSIEDAKRDLGV